MPALDIRDLLSERRLPLLDGIRAVSVLVVIAAHFGYAVPADLGVSAFFVLSGFLITWLLLREYDRTGEVSLKGFYLRRTFRIFPAYYAFLALAFVWDAVRSDPWGPGLLPSALTYTVNYWNAFNGHPGTSIAHAWSLGVEEQFYLLWPLLFLILVRRTPRAMALGLVAAIVASCAWRSFAYVVLDLGAPYAYNAFECRIDGLAAGCLLVTALRIDGAHALVRRLSARAWMPLPTLALLWVSRYQLGDGWHYTVGFTVDALLIAMAMVQMLHFPASRLWRALDGAPARFVGLISYPMYLYHTHALGIGHRLPLPRAAQFVASIAITILVAWLSYKLLEQPALRLRGRVDAWLAARRGTPAPVTQPA